MNHLPTFGDMAAKTIVETPVFDERSAVERRAFDLEMVLDDLIAAHHATPSLVAMNYLELVSAKTKIDNLLSAIKPAAAAE